MRVTRTHPAASALDARAAARELAPRLERLRHELHAHPEIGLQLPRTQERVLAELADLPLEITLGERCSSITAVLRGTAPDRPESAPAVLLRADMDGLPVTEDTGLPWASQIPGAMHACGHDLHTAMLAGAARILSEHRDQLPGDIVFMFQPGEEMHDGARVMIEEGVLDAAGPRVRAAFGVHVFANTLAQHALVSRPGAMLAAADGIRVTVMGQGGHSSAPQRAVDPVPIAAEMILALQSFVTREFDAFDPLIIGIGAVQGGDLAAPNAIPEEVRFAASVRFWSEETRQRFHTRVDELLGGIASAHRARVDVAHVSGYPVTVTDPAETRFAQDSLTAAFGPDAFTLMRNPLGGSEDFSRVLAEVPGTFIGLGATPSGEDPAVAPDNHSPRARFDDAVLPTGAAVYAELGARRLVEFAHHTPSSLETSSEGKDTGHDPHH